MTTGTGGATRILGSLRAADGRGVVRIEDRYDTDIDDLWSALTDPARLARWYGTVEGDLRRGGEFRVHIEAAGLDGVGRVEVCEPPRRLRVVTTEVDESWRENGGVPPFDHVIEATLTADGDHTALVIETSGMPLEKVAYYGVGWQVHAENLAAHVAGRAGGDDAARWAELLPSYLEQATAVA
ncbi:SRPBCC domain-containing protein [Hamadaea tsunoensis]|uniref:SRPBCC domain-containing protein n=1 Tax=Hamadaea tsunoensis TaxID=53368 RepID=UPI000427AFFC|nr:SRPBCC domain-containing protein [Hamadaea tsunoensis]